MIIRSKDELQAWLRDDLVAQGFGPKWKFRYRWTKRVAYYQRLLRLAEYRRGKDGVQRISYYVARLRLQRMSELMGFDIPLGTFGPGLAIAHRGNVVVNGDARIGKGCRIHQGVTIGGLRGKAPIIEDNVFIGPYVGIYGGVTVGSGSTIAPAAVIMQDIPPGSVVTKNDRLEINPRPQGGWKNPHTRYYETAEEELSHIVNQSSK